MSRPTTIVGFDEYEALLFHAGSRPGKIEIIASKPMATQRDLSLAYSPGGIGRRRHSDVKKTIAAAARAGGPSGGRTG